MKVKEKKILEYNETNIVGGSCMIPQKIGEKERLAILKIIENQGKEKNKTASLQ